MYSKFQITDSECLTCANKTLKGLGALQGVFGAEINYIDGIIEVSHTDEVLHKDLENKLIELGFKIVTNLNNKREIETDEPSEWGCAL